MTYNNCLREGGKLKTKTLIWSKFIPIKVILKTVDFICLRSYDDFVKSLKL